MTTDDAIQEITHAIYALNRNLKTIGDPSRKKYLYELKKRALLQLVSEGKAEKVGIHFSPNPRLSKQASDVFIEVGEFGFHIPASKEDFKVLPHLGERETDKRNPKIYYPFKKAVHVLEEYVINLPEKIVQKQKKERNLEPSGTGYFSQNPIDRSPFPKSKGRPMNRTRWSNQ